MKIFKFFNKKKTITFKYQIIDETDFVKFSYTSTTDFSKEEKEKIAEMFKSLCIHGEDLCKNVEKTK